jgi:amidase
MTDQDIAWLSIEDTAAQIRARQLSATEVAQSMLHRIERIDPGLHAFARTTPELALHRRARPMHASRADLGRCTVPIAVKDLCWTAGVPTAAGTIDRDFTPPVDGTVVRRLREAGAVLLGKLQMTEGAFSAHHPKVTAPLNPWNAQAWTGVSSSGSGVAVAAGLCHGAIGTDTGGSIRFPSVANGVTGLKPTWGRVSRHGAFELAASLDHLGPMCRSAADCGLMLGAIAGADPDDPTALQVAMPDYLAGDSQRLTGLRVGIDEAYVANDVASEVADAVHAALRSLVALGATPVAVTMPEVDPVVDAWVPHCGVEAAAAHAAHSARRAEYGPMLADLLDVGPAERDRLSRLLLTELIHGPHERGDAAGRPAADPGHSVRGPTPRWPSCARSPVTAGACRAIRRPSTCRANRPPCLRVRRDQLPHAAGRRSPARRPVGARPGVPEQHRLAHPAPAGF